jgi:hypothetical protein
VQVEARASARSSRSNSLNSNYPLPIVRKTTEGKRSPQSALSVDWCGGRCRAELATQVLGARAAAVAIAV